MDQLLERRTCPLCGCADFEVVLTMTPNRIVENSPYLDSEFMRSWGLPSDQELPIVRCGECRGVYAQLQPTNELQRRLYADDGDADEQRVAVFARPDRCGFQLRQIGTLLSEIAGRIDCDEKGVPLRPARILDYGCAYGVTLLALERPGFPYAVEAVELSEHASNYLQSQDVNVSTDIDDFDNGVFDGILLLDVLEHVAEPRDLLEKIRRVARDGSLLSINVPDFSDWRMKMIVEGARHGPIPKDVNPLEHLTYFSPESLMRTLRSAGWEPYHPDTCLVKYKKANSKMDLLKGIVRSGRDFVRNSLYGPHNYTTNGLYIAA